MKGILYIVATPIGNFGDISQRAIEILNSVDVILAEDTRHSKILLSKFRIQNPLQNLIQKIYALHEHNELEQAEKFCRWMLEEGKSIALISDAGTPLISDPGYVLVRKAHDLGIKVVPIPGPSALITALSASGLPTDRFVFEGFLPPKKKARQKRLEELRGETRTLIFYEAPHRILETLEDMLMVMGETREAVLARELTKAFETIYRANLINLLHFVKSDANQSRGEIVLLVAGVPQDKKERNRDTQEDSDQGNTVIEGIQRPSEETFKILKILAAELPPKQAASLTSKITGESKQILYDILAKKP